MEKENTSSFAKATEDKSKKVVGHISQIIGAVINVRFESQEVLPSILQE